MRESLAIGNPEQLTALFSPASVAIVGASDDRDRLSGRPLRYLLEAGYAGRIYPVNPKRDTVQGLRAYGGVDALPETPDLALVAVPAPAVLGAVHACARRGIAGAYLLSGGFAERGEDGLRVQREVHAIAGTAGMRLLGPNCLGAFNSHIRFFGTFATSLETGLPKAGPVAIVSQSGAYGQHLAYLLRRRDLGVGYLVTTGNEVDVELAECVSWLSARSDVGVIAIYAEGIRNGPLLLAALEQARQACKPVVIVKVGTSTVGARAAASHTAALAGSDEVFDAAVRQVGAYRARGCEEQVDVVYACTRTTARGGRRIGIVSVSGGIGIQAADAALGAGMVVPALSADVGRSLDAVLDAEGVENPIDVTGQVANDLRMLSSTFDVLAREPAIDVWLTCLTTVPLAAALRRPLCDALRTSAVALRGRAVSVVCAIADATTVAMLEECGFLVFEDVDRAVRAVAALATLREHFDKPPRRPRALMPYPHDWPIPSEVTSKAMLRALGIATLDERLVASAEEAVRAAKELGFPVALKVVSAHIPHKTEIGGVLLNLADARAVRQGFTVLCERVSSVCPDAVLDGILVSPMAPHGVEVIIGTAQDPVFGPVVMFGLGGTLAECLRDVSLRIGPIEVAEARLMIAETRAASLLDGWRSRPRGDIDAVARALVVLAEFAAANSERVATVDVNPLLVLPEGEGVIALDAWVAQGT